ncbi:basic proline-rich protein-like [Mirounga angustirostris]|uniref:basic proline-rich protein-like n=1 Tax=Mirounga angustirostris TaxID=9716 RepID=UPI001E6876AD
MAFLLTPQQKGPLPVALSPNPWAGRWSRSSSPPGVPPAPLHGCSASFPPASLETTGSFPRPPPGYWPCLARKRTSALDLVSSRGWARPGPERPPGASPPRSPLAVCVPVRSVVTGTWFPRQFGGRNVPPPGLLGWGVSRPTGPRLSWLWLAGPVAGAGRWGSRARLPRGGVSGGPGPAAWALGVCGFASVSLPGKKSPRQLKATPAPRLPHPCALQRSVTTPVSVAQPSGWVPLVPEKQLSPSAPRLTSQHPVSAEQRWAGPALRLLPPWGGLQSPGHTSKLERCADFPTPGSRGSRVSQAPAFSPFHQLQATGP